MPSQPMPLIDKDTPAPMKKCDACDGVGGEPYTNALGRQCIEMCMRCLGTGSVLIKPKGAR